MKNLRKQAIFHCSLHTIRFIHHEQWKTIPGFSKYEASTDGNIRNAKSKKLLSVSTRSVDNPRLSLVGDNGKTTMLLNRLILLTFKSLADGDAQNLCAARIDGNCMNNKLSNLEWRTRQQMSQMKKMSSNNTKMVTVTTMENDTILEQKTLPSVNAAKDYITSVLKRRPINILPHRSKIINDIESNRKCIIEYCNTSENNSTVMDIDSGEKWMLHHVGKKNQKYFVSNYGRVKLKYSKRELLKKQQRTDGYCRVHFTIDNKQKLYQVHQLVAELFVPNPHNYSWIDHIN